MEAQQIKIKFPEQASDSNTATTRFTVAGREYILFVTLQQDSNPTSPKDSADEHAFLVYGHRDFTVDGPQDQKALEIHRSKAKWEETHYVHEVYAYIHSGVRLKLGTAAGFPDRQWDVSMCGYCLVTRDAQEIPEPAKYAEGIIEEWNQYLSGDVWGYDIAAYRLEKDSEGDAIEENDYYQRHAKPVGSDSCWGFYGWDYALSEATSVATSITAGITSGKAA